MASLRSLKIQHFRLGIFLLLLVSFFLPNSWASQDAVVTAERAIIFSDPEMTSPIGYVPRGKRVTVGEVPRNRAQVYPIIVSGRIAYIRVLDLSTEKESVDAHRLVAERFIKSAQRQYKTDYSLSYLNFNSKIGLTNQNGKVADGDPMMWNGVSLKGEVLLAKVWDLQILTNYMQTTSGEETFRMVEFGAGIANRLVNTNRFILRAGAQVLSVPYARYELGKRVRLNSYGITFGAGISGTYNFDQHWGLEAMAALTYTRMLAFKKSHDATGSFKDFAPTFVGNRIGVGISYRY